MLRKRCQRAEPRRLGARGMVALAGLGNKGRDLSPQISSSRRERERERESDSLVSCFYKKETGAPGGGLRDELDDAGGADDLHPANAAPEAPELRVGLERRGRERRQAATLGLNERVWRSNTHTFPRRDARCFHFFSETRHLACLRGTRPHARLCGAARAARDTFLSRESRCTLRERERERGRDFFSSRDSRLTALRHGHAQGTGSCQSRRTGTASRPSRASRRGRAL